MQAHRFLPFVSVAVPIFLISAAALAAEPTADYREFLRQVREEMRAIQQHEALLKKEAPKPGPSPQQQLLDDERVRQHFEQARTSQGERPKPAPEPRGDADKAAREFVGTERGRAAERHAERVDRLVESAREHSKRGRLDAAAKALRTALEIDPRNERAAGLLKQVETDREVADDVRTKLTVRRETAESLRYVGRLRTPQAAFLTVPKGWAERHEARLRDLVAREAGADAADETAVVNKALAKKISIEAITMSLDDVAAYLRQVAGINIVLQQDVAQKTVDLRLMNTSVESVLAWVTKLTGLSYAVRGGVVHIGTRENLAAAAVVKIYDVSDILRVRRLLRKNRRRNRDIFDEEVATMGELAEELMQFVKDATGRTRWGGDPGQAQMNFRLGRLVVNAEPALQMKVLQVLSNVRD